MALTFEQLRSANVQRLPRFTRADGQPAHSKSDGSDWSLGVWMCALAGEVGEAANIVKEIERGDVQLQHVWLPLADELADVQIYLDLVAFRAGVDLAAATVRKFNRATYRCGLNGPFL